MISFGGIGDVGFVRVDFVDCGVGALGVELTSLVVLGLLVFTEVVLERVVILDEAVLGAAFLVVGVVDLVRVVDLVGLIRVDVVGLADFGEEDALVLARLVLSPSIDLFESIIYNYNMKVQKITKKQQAVLNFLEDFTEENGYSPSYREIMTGLGLSSVSAVAEHIDNMVSKGILKKVPGAARSLEVLDFRHTETVELFRSRLEECTEGEREALLKAAEILGLDLEISG